MTAPLFPSFFTVNGRQQISAADIPFNPTETGHWNPQPTTLLQAVDQVGSRGDLLMWGAGSIFPTTVTRYLAFFDFESMATTDETEVLQPVLNDIVLGGFGIRHRGAGSNDPVVYTVRKNQTDTIYTLEVDADDVTVVGDTSKVVLFSPGDFVSVEVEKAGNITPPDAVQAFLLFR